MSDDRKKWLDKLEVGDVVTVNNRDVGDGAHRFGIRKGVVRSITPKRTKFVVSNPQRGSVMKGTDEDVFDKYGEYRVGGTWGRTVRMDLAGVDTDDRIANDNVKILARNKVRKLINVLSIGGGDAVHNLSTQKKNEFTKLANEMLALFEGADDDSES